jgi:hypothetical protein
MFILHRAKAKPSHVQAHGQEQPLRPSMQLNPPLNNHNASSEIKGKPNQATIKWYHVHHV